MHFSKFVESFGGQSKDLGTALQTLLAQIDNIREGWCHIGLQIV